MEQAYEETSYLNTADLSGHTWESTRWLERKSIKDERRCKPCEEEHGKIISVREQSNYRVESHPNCRCYLAPLTVIEAGYATKDGVNGADYWLYYSHKLPEYYITKEQAKILGWKNKKGNLAEVAPEKMIGGGLYNNQNGHLPSAPRRVWYEADISYISGFRSDCDRILYSNDGLIFVTCDHYETFYEISERRT
ncbi:MAG: phage head morphogenesis protein [Clostridia bacterium]|nr:phage head morphogenesis protein [Clostridia bacterium]